MKIAFSFSNRMVGALTGLVLAIGLAGCQDEMVTKKELILLIDRTVDNREMIIARISEVEERFIAVLNSKDNTQKKQLLGLDVRFSYIDENGANEMYKELCSFPTSAGKKFQKLRDAGSKCSANFSSLRASLKNDDGKHNSSMIIEAIAAAIGKVEKSNGSLVVISDLNVVDKQNNFERGQVGDFSVPRLLNPNKIPVEILSVSVNGQSLAKTSLVKAWWRDSLLGTKEFGRVRTTYDAEQSNTRKSNGHKSSQKSLTKKVSLKKIAKAPKILQQLLKKHLIDKCRPIDPDDTTLVVSFSSSGQVTELKGYPENLFSDCARQYLVGHKIEKANTGRPTELILIYINRIVSGINYDEI